MLDELGTEMDAADSGDHSVDDFDWEHIKSLAGQIKNKVETIRWILEWVKNYNDGLKFKDEMKLKIEEIILWEKR